MGLTYVTLRIANPAKPSAKRKVDVLVDTGAIISVFPEKTMRELGIKPLTRRRFKAFGGAVIDRSVGGIVLEYDGAKAIAEAAFGRPEDTAILGVTGMETLGLVVDPKTKKLKQVDLLML